MSKPIRGVARTLDMLLCFSQDQPELTPSEIAELVQLHKSTALRALCTLARRRLVQHDAGAGKYERGLSVREM